MNGYYANKIKVVTDDSMSFPADAVTLEALACSCYDPQPFDDSEPVAIITVHEWNHRMNKRKIPIT